MTASMNLPLPFQESLRADLGTPPKSCVAARRVAQSACVGLRETHVDLTAVAWGRNCAVLRCVRVLNFLRVVVGCQVWKERHMPKTEDDLKTEIAVIDASRKEAIATISHVRMLLIKADARRNEGGGHRWNEVLNNLEGTLDVARSKLTACELRLRHARDQLHQLRTTGTIDESALGADAADVKPDLSEGRLRAAEHIMSMSVEDLRELTLEEVADMHDEHFRKEASAKAEAVAETSAKSEAVAEAAAKAQAATKAQATERAQAATPKTALDRRIENARRAKEEREAARRNKGAGPIDRRKQIALRGAVAKLLQGGSAALGLEEVESIVDCRKDLMGRNDLNASEQALRAKLEPMGEELEAHMHELRRKRAQGYLRR